MAAGASLEAYRALMARLSIARCVVVQPSTYGADNRCTMDAVAALGDRARAVVVVTPETGEAELDRLTRAGAVGIRYFMLPGGVLPWELLPGWPRASMRMAGTSSSSSTAARSSRTLRCCAGCPATS